MIRLYCQNICIAVLMSLTFVSCSSKKQDAVTPATGSATDREAMLINMADSIIIPGYAGFKVKLDAMRSKSDAFRTTPSAATLTTFRQAWTEAYIEWQKVELFDVGPAFDPSLRSYMNIYPISISAINGNISSGAANLEGGAYNTQGFAALDYLINGLGATDQDILVFYTTDTDAAKRIAYLLKLTDQMNTKFTKVQSDWLTYRDVFVASTETDINSSTSLVVNGFVYHYERFIRSGKIGIPSAAGGGSPIPEDVEAYYKKDLSLTLVKTAQQACVDFFNGKSFKTQTAGYSLKDYLNSVNAKDSKTGQSLTDILNTQFITVSDKLNLLTDNLSSEVENNNTAMLAVYTEMQKVVRLLKVDMPSAMGITITFSDNDGD